MSRAGTNNFLQAIGSLARRFTASTPSFWYGVIGSYDPDTHFATAILDVGVDSSGNVIHYETPPSQLMVPYHGQGYGKGTGPLGGEQCVVGVLDPHGDEFVILGFTTNDPQPALGIPAGDDWTVASGVLRRVGGTRAALFAADGPTELGGENLNATNDAVLTVTKFNAWQTEFLNSLQTFLNANFQHGVSTAPKPPSTTIEGSSLARAVP